MKKKVKVLKEMVMNNPEFAAKLKNRISKIHTQLKSDVKTGRNDQCPCGSGIKFKKCCINKGD